MLSVAFLESKVEDGTWEDFIEADDQVDYYLLDLRAEDINVAPDPWAIIKFPPAGDPKIVLSGERAAVAKMWDQLSKTESFYDPIYYDENE